jgi:hypothetical protein
MEGSAVKGLDMLQLLCGEDFYSNVYFGTTFWDIVETPIGIAREQELVGAPQFWGHMIDGGSQYHRIPLDKPNCLRFVSKMARLPEKCLQAQVEVVEKGQSLEQTSASSIYQSKLQLEYSARVDQMELEVQLSLTESLQMLRKMELSQELELEQKSTEYKAALQQAKRNLELEQARAEKDLEKTRKQATKDWNKQKLVEKKRLIEEKKAENEARAQKIREDLEKAEQENRSAEAQLQATKKIISNLPLNAYRAAQERARSRYGQLLCDRCDGELDKYRNHSRSQYRQYFPRIPLSLTNTTRMLRL